jgi:two-component system response regulator AdeR
MEQGWPRAAGPVVLVVEDDPGVAALLAEVLAGAGYAPATTDSALGAAALARRLRPAAVLLDLGLPYRSGGALLDDLKADRATAAIPVLVVTALAEVLPPARRALAAGVVAKPFSPAALLTALRRACAPAGGAAPARAAVTTSPGRRPGAPPSGPPAPR